MAHQVIHCSSTTEMHGETVMQPAAVTRLMLEGCK